MDSIVRLNHVTIRYGNRVALDDVSFTIEPNEYAALLGPNGSGKTTLIQALLGRIVPESGSVEVFGKDPRQHSFADRRRIGYVAQYNDVDIRFPLSVIDMVKMGRFAHLGLISRPTPRDNELAEKALEDMGISDLAHRSIREISGGQFQRALIARALAGRPEFLILDEPTSGLDTPAIGNLYDTIALIRKKHELTILLVSHDVGVVIGMVDKIACLATKLVAHGRPTEALTNEAVECMYGKNSTLFTHGIVPHMVVKPHMPKGKPNG